MSKPAVLAVMAVCAAGAVALSLGRSRAELTSAPAGDAASRAEVRALRSELAALKRDVSRLPEGSPAALQTAAPQEPNAQPVKADAPPAEPVDDPATALSVRIAAEPVDTAWANGAERQLRDVITTRVPGARVVESECASSLCRVLVEQESAEQQLQLATLVADQEPFREGVYYEYDNDSQRPRTTLFVLRPGSSFVAEAAVGTNETQP